MSMKITQKTSFSAAHRLLNYDGSCKQLHGHQWKIFISIESDKDLDKCSMLLDYRTIKNYIKDNYDHRAILNEKDPLVDILRNIDLKVTTIVGNPTAENIANKILEDMITLAKLNKSWDHCTVIVCESPDNSAEVSL